MCLKSAIKWGGLQWITPVAKSLYFLAQAPSAAVVCALIRCTHTHEHTVHPHHTKDILGVFISIFVPVVRKVLDSVSFCFLK